jgi:hypothetical protein
MSKRIVLVSSLAALFAIAGCDSTAASKILGGGEHDTSLVGTWLMQTESIDGGGDTSRMVLNANGSFTNTTHSVISFNGTIDSDERCSYAGTWSTSAGKILSNAAGTCTETANGQNQTSPSTLKDTASYSFEGAATLKLDFGYGDTTYSMVFAKQ